MKKCGCKARKRHSGLEKKNMKNEEYKNCQLKDVYKMRQEDMKK